MDDDHRWLARAIALGTRAAPSARPNPPVGCVLVRDGRVVGEGWTRPVGGPHAEVVALGAAGTDAAGATAYVSLEPCDHTGRTGPCTRALLEADIARVVHAQRDPDPVAGGGTATLEAAGVAVTALDVGDGWNQLQLAPFVRDVTDALPSITVKLAITEGGATIAPAGRWITGERARQRVHRQRAAADAVLVGIGTVLADDPRLDVRHVAAVGGQPRPVVLDTHLRTPVSSQVVRRGALLLCGPDVDEATSAALEAAGAEVVAVPAAADGRPDPRAAAGLVRAIAGAQVVYAEPGPTLAAALISAGTVQRVLLHVGDVAPGDAVAAVQRAPLPLEGWTLDRLVHVGADVEVGLVPALSRT